MLSKANGSFTWYSLNSKQISNLFSFNTFQKHVPFPKKWNATPDKTKRIFKKQALETIFVNH